jgi:hypothetical protein
MTRTKQIETGLSIAGRDDLVVLGEEHSLKHALHPWIVFDHKDRAQVSWRHQRIRLNGGNT